MHSRFKLRQDWDHQAESLTFAAAADVSQDPPKHLVGNIENFLKTDAVEKLQAIISAAQSTCENLFDKRAEDDKKRKKQKNKDINLSTPTLKDEIAHQSQKLVMQLVETIEKEQLLQDGVYAENLKYDSCCSEDNIASWKGLNITMAVDTYQIS